MTTFTDGIRFGEVTTDGGQIGTNGTVSDFTMVPEALSANGIALSQAVAAAGFVNLNGAKVSANSGQAILDHARRVTITSSGNDTGITFLVVGGDMYGKRVTQLVTGASGAAATTLKTFKTVASVFASGAVAGTITVGYSNAFGLPVVADQAASVVAGPKWSTVLTQDAGTFVAADVTSPATNLTGDVRGVYTPSSVADGVKRLAILLAVRDATDQAGTFGVTQA